MASYTLSGTGTQALTANTAALHVTITTLPAGTGSGGAQPLDYYGVGFIRPGNATAFWEPFVVCGGPQWMPVPQGTTRIGYALFNSAVVSVAEVFGSSPLAFPLASLPDVALASVADAQVLAYQASTSKWINATPTGGGSGGTAGSSKYDEQIIVTPVSSVRIPASGSIPATSRNIRITAQVRSSNATAVGLTLQLNGDTGGNYDWQRMNAAGTVQSNDQGTGQSSYAVGSATGSGSAAGVASQFICEILNYSGTTFHKTMTTLGMLKDGTSVSVFARSGAWRNTAAITSVTISCGSGNFAAGSTFSTYLEA